MPAAIRPDVLKAIRQAWPHGVIEMPLDDEDSYFPEVYPKLRNSLSRLAKVSLVYEREPDPPPEWNAESDPDEDPPDWNENPRSYHLFFLSPVDERFSYQTEIEELDEGEEDSTEVVPGEGRYGCSVGVSLVAPFAVVTLDCMEQFENGDTTLPSIEHTFCPEKGVQVQVLEKLRDRLAAILESHGIAVLPPQELAKPVPFLRPGEGTFLEGKPLTVQDAFFFEGA
jgi:hypothetical protein